MKDYLKIFLERDFSFIIVLLISVLIVYKITTIDSNLSIEKRLAEKYVKLISETQNKEKEKLNSWKENT